MGCESHRISTRRHIAGTEHRRACWCFYMLGSSTYLVSRIVGFLCVSCFQLIFNLSASLEKPYTPRCCTGGAGHYWMDLISLYVVTGGLAFSSTAGCAWFGSRGFQSNARAFERCSVTSRREFGVDFAYQVLFPRNPIQASRVDVWSRFV